MEAAAAAPGPQERLVDGVLRFVVAGEHPVAVHMQFPRWRTGEPREGGLVTGDGHACGPARLTSWTSQLLPSGSLKEKNEP